MLPQFDGMDQWIPRSIREALSAAVSGDAFAVDRRVLTDGVATSPHAASTSQIGGPHPARSTAPPMLSSLTGKTAASTPATGHLHGAGIRYENTSYFAGVGWRYFSSIPSASPSSTAWSGSKSSARPGQNLSTYWPSFPVTFSCSITLNGLGDTHSVLLRRKLVGSSRRAST
jgi:hypothetical protein